MVGVFTLVLWSQGEDFMDELRCEDEHQCLHVSVCVHVKLWEWMCLTHLPYNGWLPECIIEPRASV